LSRYARAEGDDNWLLLTMDSHGSHLSPEIMEYAWSKKVFLLAGIPNATHLFQVGHSFLSLLVLNSHCRM
jgi:hypothetical protein